MALDTERTEQLFRRLQRLLKRLPDHTAPDDIHQFRTSVRRLETLLDVLLPEPDRDGRKLVKQFAKLRRRAGEVRDLDVQTAALRSLRIGTDGARKAQLLEDLTRSRGKSVERLVKRLDKADSSKLRRRLEKLQERLALVAQASGPGANGTRMSVQDPVALALRDFARLFRRVPETTEENLHRLRLECKRIRYTAEIAGDTPAARAVVNALKKMQDAIGTWHDWLVLTQRAERLFRDQSQVPLLAALRNVTRARFTEAVRVVQDGRRDLLRLHRRRRTKSSLPAAPASAPQSVAAIAS